MRFIFTLILVTLLKSALAQLQDGFVQRQVARNLNPTTITFSPDGRLFVVDKDGSIREIINDVLASDPFLTLTNVDTYNERGLSGLCFHPDFPRTPYLYVYYTVKGAEHNRLSRFTVVSGVPDPKSEKTLLDFDPLLGTIHNAGVLRFGPDRKLYVAVGEGSNATAAQSLSSLLGKVLRLNDDGSFPADNPFANQLAAPYKAIYALGFRNPFSMDINPVSGQILVGDVGGDLFEEIDVVQAGGNYGWPLIEGRRTSQDAPSNYVDPIYAYNHDSDCAVAGLAIYNPPTVRFPAEYKGRAFFADYCGGTIKTLDPATGQIINTFVTGIDRPVALATSPDGYLYYVARAGQGGGALEDNTSSTNGSVYKVSFFDSGLPYISRQSTSAFVPVGEAVTFEVEAVGQKPLIYTWYRNGKVISGANQSQYTLTSPTLDDNGATFNCIISNALGADSSDVMSLRVVQAQRPIASISQPVSNTTYKAGDLITFAGSALNASQQPLTNAKLTWWINFHHEDHTHPALDPVSGISTGTYRVPRVGETSTEVWYRIHLLVTDVSGLTNETYVDVKPEIATVTIGSSLTGIRIYLEGQPQQVDLTFQSVVGMLRSLETKPYLATSDGFYKFLGWGNNQNAPLITYEVPSGSPNLAMNYEAITPPKGNGLLGEYYNNSSEITGTPTVTRVDNTIDFNWGEGSPSPLIGDDNFVTRWTGKVQAPLTDTYTFYTETDDGVRLWVDKKLLIDKWGLQPSSQWSGQASLVAGQVYDIQMDYLENAGYATARLFWGSDQFEKAIVSKPYLFSPQVITATTPEAEGGFIVFPSPAQDQATVRYTALMSGSAQLEVTDLLGRSIYERPIRFITGVNEYAISVADWPAGLYQIVVRPANQPALHRRLVVH
ncbi:PQQ-dependent sugar dehydrogenase [Spirosoma foliorum]|uniref:PQQ-dependent sugar dehydrogenase n=1 Tax=Spirosoma foliorum TaxID=2710596 RepID=A0A7G5GU04_9BACT|nr:PQQ-dependent sugar dehydrogenase [Spirosoma foliorum]QMW02346.1 PQQ-dependent sugar dehydrogenase [Spirosoma foliorum]